MAALATLPVRYPRAPDPSAILECTVMIFDSPESESLPFRVWPTGVTRSTDAGKMWDLGDDSRDRDRYRSTIAARAALQRLGKINIHPSNAATLLRILHGVRRQCNDENALAGRCAPADLGRCRIPVEHRHLTIHQDHCQPALLPGRDGLRTVKAVITSKPCRSSMRRATFRFYLVIVNHKYPSGRGMRDRQSLGFCSLDWRCMCDPRLQHSNREPEHRALAGYARYADLRRSRPCLIEAQHGIDSCRFDGLDRRDYTPIGNQCSGGIDRITFVRMVAILTGAPSFPWREEAAVDGQLRMALRQVRCKPSNQSGAGGCSFSAVQGRTGLNRPDAENPRSIHIL